MPLLDKTLFRVYVTGMDGLVDDSAKPVERESDLKNSDRQPQPVNEPPKDEITNSYSMPVHCEDESASVSLDEAIKRHRCVTGLFAQKKLEPSEALVIAMSHSVKDKVRSLQKTQDTRKKSTTESDQDVLSPYIASVLASPDISAEARLKKIINEGLPKPSKPKTLPPSVQWKTTKNVDGIFDNNIGVVRKEIEIEEEIDLSPRIQDVHQTQFQPLEQIAVTPEISQIDIPSVPDIPAEFQTEPTEQLSETPLSETVAECPPMDEIETSENTTDELESNILTFARPKCSLIRSKEVVAHWPQSCEKMRFKAADQIRCLVDHIETKIHSGYKSVALCGNSPGSGCSTILLCCSREIARRGWKTLMIDGHFENPSLSDFLEIPVESGWESIFVPNSIDDDVLLTLDKNLDLLPLAGSSVRGARKLLFDSALESDCFENIIRQYDAVLIDSGCFQSTTPDKIDEKLHEISRFNPDGVLFILGGDRANRNELLPIEQQQIRKNGLVQIGIAENYF